LQKKTTIIKKEYTKQVHVFLLMLPSNATQVP
jgi:hypothetical protein